MTRDCLLGCTVRGQHYPGCSGDPASVYYRGDRCTGCLPASATDGSLLCDRCARRLRHAITEAPDLCVRIRSSIDPMKAQVYDREKLGGPMSSESKPPMSLDAIEAADEVLAILTYWAEEFGDEMRYRLHTFEAGVDEVDAYHQAKFPADYLLSIMDGILNDTRVAEFARAVLGPREKVLVDDEMVEPWTIERALRRWPDYERDRMSSTPCPECDMRTVRMRPPRVFGQPTLLRCINAECRWEPPKDEQVLWMEAFGIRLHVHAWQHLPEMPVGELSCSCGAVAEEIVQGWDVVRDDGLVVIADVDAGIAREQTRYLNDSTRARRYRVRLESVPDGVRVTREAEPLPLVEAKVVVPTPVRAGRQGGSMVDLDLEGLDRDARRPVCPVCWLIPCGCEAAA